MTEYKRIAIDTSKTVFTLHGVDWHERVSLRRNLRRAEVAAFMAKLPHTDVVLEACGASHHWARVLQAAGHTVRLIPPQYVKPFVKRGKNDRNDAEAISEAASRPTMRFVPVKSAQQQADTAVLSVRDLAVRQRTQLVNALRGHAGEFGAVAAQGPAGLARLRQAVSDNTTIPPAARDMVAFLGQQIDRIDADIASLDLKLKALHKANPVSRLLADIPGIGPIGALTLALRIDPGQFKSGRHMAAWIGLAPKERSTGGKQHLGGISRAGDEQLRQLLVLGATAVIRYAQPGQQTRATKPRKPSASASAWLLSLLERRPRKVAAVALANKMARIAWAMMTSGEQYRRNTLAPA